MTRMDLLKTLDEWDKKGVWVFKMRDFYLLFSKENPQIIKAALARHEKKRAYRKDLQGSLC